MAQPRRLQGMPPLNMPFLSPDGTVNVIWYRFLQSIWTKSGLGPYKPGHVNRIGVVESGLRRASGGEITAGGPNASIAYHVVAGDPFTYITVYDVQTGEMIGSINFDGVFPP